MEQIKEEYITFETAKLAKEKGFSWEQEEISLKNFRDYNEVTIVTKGVDGAIPPNGFKLCYNEEGREISPKYYVVDNPHYPRPTQAMLAKWLRETHNILVFSMPVADKKTYYWWIGDLWGDGSIEDSSERPFDETYEEAFEKGLYEGLKLIKNV